MTKGVLVSVLGVALCVSGCAQERPVFLSADTEVRLPQTVAECQEAARESIRRNRASNSAAAGAIAASTTEAALIGGFIGAVIGSAITSGNIESRYRQCLARVGASPNTPLGSSAPGGLTDGQARRAVLPPPAECIPGAGVIQGGNRYCIGQ